MIDTIVIRLHNLRQYENIADTLLKKNEGVTIKDIVDPHKKTALIQFKEVEYGDSGKTVSLYTNKILTSSHYYLAYRIDMRRDFIDFNFSIPKYLYGTNIKQFVPHQDDHYYSEHFKWDKTCVEVTYQRLMSFLTEFFYEVFGENQIDDMDVEINRIDLCYNQIFDTKEEALRYLDYQKRIRKKYLPEHSKNKHSYDTSVFLKTERYTAKIYHKGSEYTSSNGEIGRHRKINEEQQEEKFPVDNKFDEEGNVIREGLHSIADRILRYEISFRSSYMAHLHKKHLYAKHCSMFQEMKKVHTEVKQVYDKCMREAKKELTIDYLDPKEEKAIINKYMKPFYEYDKHKVRTYKDFESIMSQRMKFMLRLPESDHKDNETIRFFDRDSRGNPKIARHAMFSKDLFQILASEFVDFMEQFQVNDELKFEEIDLKIMEYNQEVDEWNRQSEEKKQKVCEERVKRILLMLKHHSLDELVRLGAISRRTKYNFKGDIEKIRKTNVNLATLTSSIPDYKLYLCQKIIFNNI